jgi:curved DNA-binding protein CbpA
MAPNLKELEAQRVAALASVSLYSVLGIRFDASDSEIKLAYRKQALRFHPDKNNSSAVPSAERAFKTISIANTCLSDAQHRERYDMFGIVEDAQGVSDFTRADLVKFTAELKETKLKELLQLYLRELDSQATKEIAAEMAAFEEQSHVPDDEKEKSGRASARELPPSVSPLRQQLMPQTDFAGGALVAFMMIVFGIYFYSSAKYDSLS